MPQPPTNPVFARELVREVPFNAQHTFRGATLGAAGVFAAAFDLGLRITDVNQFLTPATLPTGSASGQNPTPQAAVGPFLDAVWFSDQIGTIITEFAVDVTCLWRTVTTTGVAVNTLGNISGLRVTGRFVQVSFVNGAIAANVEFGVYVRSR